MFLNDGHFRVRHRFSAAHELAHILLSPMQGSLPIHRRRFSPDQDPEGKRIEALCDKMASSILMPRGRIAPLIASSGSSAKCVPQIADSFGVSFEAAARRFVAVSSGRFAVLFWKQKDTGHAEYTKHPVRSPNLDASWGELVLSPQQGRPSASWAMERSGLIDSQEAVVLWFGKGKRKRRERLEDVKVESFGRSRGRYRHVVSFVHVP